MRLQRARLLKLHLLVVMKTTGYGLTTAPSGWAEHRVCPAKQHKIKYETEEENKQEHTRRVRLHLDKN